MNVRNTKCSPGIQLIQRRVFRHATTNIVHLWLWTAAAICIGPDVDLLLYLEQRGKKDSNGAHVELIDWQLDSCFVPQQHVITPCGQYESDIEAHSLKARWRTIVKVGDAKDANPSNVLALGILWVHLRPYWIRIDHLLHPWRHHYFSSGLQALA